MIYHNNNKIIKAYQNGDLVNKIDKVVSGSTPSSRLPSGYTEVEYIENTSTAYINTGFKPNQDTRIVCEMQCVTSTNSVLHFGTGGWDRTDGMWLTYETGISGTLHIAWCNETTWSTYSSVIGDYNKHTYDWDKNNIYKDNALVASNTYSNFTCSDNLAIFTTILNGTSYESILKMQGRVYWFKIFDNGTLVRDFIPCKNPNNVAGLYDIINDVFYSSPNNVAFTAGSPITPSTAVTSESNTIFQYVVNEVEPTPPTPIDYSKQYLTTVALTDNVTFTLTGGNGSNTFQYSTDSGETWNNIQIGQTTTAINNGEKMYWKASNPSINSERGIGTILPSASSNVEGNIMSLKYGDNFSGETALSQFQFRKLFSGATHIVSAENMVLPSTTFQKQCYSQMFQGCTSLTTPPTVIGTSDATFSGDYCLSDMFANCSSLTTAPQLPMTSLGAQCYWYMLQNCTSLTTAPLLPAASISTQSYRGMFNGCTSLNSVTCLATTNITSSNCNEWLKDVAASGTFTKAANASWSTTGQNGIPNGWTVVDYSE